MKKNKRKRGALDSSDDEDEEEDEEKMREEMGDFIVDQDEEEEEEEEDRSRRKKKKKRRRRRSGSGSGSGSSGSRSGSASDRSRSASKRRSRTKSDDGSDLDEDDMDLIEENLGVKLQKKRSRIQRMDSDESEEERQAGSGSEEELPDVEARPARSGSEEDDDDEGLQDFIVDEEGKPIERKKQRKKHIFDDSQRQLAEDIFGVAFDYEEFEQYEDGEEEESEEEDYEDEEEEEEDRPRRRDKKRRRKAAKTIFDIFDPFDLEQGHYTDQDQEIRNTDIPERMQLRQVPVTAVPDDSEELDREAEWICKHGFTKQTLSKQPNFTREECENWHSQTQTTEKIKKALDFMRQQFLEVPFIAFYRKEYVHPELDINALWRVYFMDEKWCQLQARKKNIRRLMEKMQTYQTDCLLAELDSELPEGVPLLGQEDLDRLEMVETVEELKDAYQHFLLYHGRQIPACQEYHRKKAKEEKAERRARKKAGKQKKYKTVTRTIKRKATKTITRTVTETVTNEETGEEEEIDKEVEEEVETEVESEAEEEVTDEEAMEEDGEEDEDEEDDENEDEEEEVIKHATRNDAYSLCVKYKLSSLSKCFGLTPEQFGENLQGNYMKHETVQEGRDLDELAADYLSEKLKSKDDVTKAAVFMVATQLSREPSVRQTAREVFYERATINVKPTKKGMKEIGEDHDIYSMKYLKDKPVRNLEYDQFLRLKAAADTLLIEMTIGEDIVGTTSPSYIDEAVELYKYDGFSNSIKEWNALRRAAVEMTFKKMLFPQLRLELMNRLRAEAIEGIKHECREKLMTWIQWAPYRVDFDDMEDEEDWDCSGGARILGISYSPDRSDASYAALISPEGEVVDYIKLSHLLSWRDAWQEKERLGKEQDVEALTKIIRNKRPHGIAICAEDRFARQVKADIEDIIEHLSSNGDNEFPAIKTILVDSNLAKVYANTNKSSVDFRDYPAVLKQAISTARRLQDPLVEFSQLCNPENDILCLRYHPLQDLVGDEDLLQALNLNFINLVNAVGVNINECVAHPHSQNLIQFVGGLGPRKGASLLKTLRGMAVPRLENRQQLVTSCHMGPKVFINCAGFIKIDTSALGDSEQYIEVLDGSRIHNEAYEWARKMAVDALEYDDDENEGEGNPASAIEDILKQPEKLDELNLDAFAEELERQGFGNKQITLYDIRAELHNMYKDNRRTFEMPNEEEEFEMVTKETNRTFHFGKLMQAQVTRFTYSRPKQEELDNAAPRRIDDTNMWECPFCGKNDFPELTEVWNHFDAVDECPGKCVGVNVRLDNGVMGFIHLKDLSDSELLKPHERVQIGQKIYVRITKIDCGRFQANCISKSSALRDDEGIFKPEKDVYFDKEAAQKDRDELEKQTKQKHGSTYIKRVIVHPSFHNISYKEAEKLLNNMDQGDVIIRPSSKGEDHLTVSWKVCDNIYQHIDVKEQGKANSFSLGQSLWIGGEEYEDLDEIIARYVNPMANNTRDLLAYKYYRDTEGGNRKIAEDFLFAEKKLVPSKIHYILHASKEFPGKFMLSYIPRDKVRHEFVSVTPEGFRFRKQNMDSVGQLIKWFKEHFRDPIPGTPNTPGGSRSAMRTPYGRATPGGPLRPGITPGAMSMAGGLTPYGQTPGGGGAGGRSAAPYTPTATTPFMAMTPLGTPGPSMTPRGGGYGGGTPRAAFSGGQMGPPRGGSSGATPRHPGSGTPRGGSLTPRHPGGMTPGGSSSRPPSASPGQGGSYRGRGSSAGNLWAAAAESWAAKSRAPPSTAPRTEPSKGYSTTPRYEDPRRTPHYGQGGRTPTQPGTSRSSGQTPSQVRTPKGAYGDATPLYDE